MKPILSIAAAFLLAGSLSGCIGGAAVMALSNVATVAAIAKDVLDVDISLHSLLGNPQKEQIKPAELVQNPTLIMTGK